MRFAERLPFVAWALVSRCRVGWGQLCCGSAGSAAGSVWKGLVLRIGPRCFSRQHTWMPPGGSVCREVCVSYGGEELCCPSLSLFDCNSTHIALGRMSPVRQALCHPLPGAGVGGKLDQFWSERNSEAWGEKSCWMLLVLQLTPFVGSTNTDGEADSGRSCSKGFRLCGPPCSVLVLSTKPRMNGISSEEQ